MPSALKALILLGFCLFSYVNALDGRRCFLYALRFHDPLPDVCVGAVTSVRMTPLEKVRLLRMAEKSLDILR